jgi:hypothetical protein
MLTTTGVPFCWAIIEANVVGSIVGSASTDAGQDGDGDTSVEPPEVHPTSASTTTSGATMRAGLDVMRAW